MLLIVTGEPILGLFRINLRDYTSNLAVIALHASYSASVFMIFEVFSYWEVEWLNHSSNFSNELGGQGQFFNIYALR